MKKLTTKEREALMAHIYGEHGCAIPTGKLGYVVKTAALITFHEAAHQARIFAKGREHGE